MISEKIKTVLDSLVLPEDRDYVIRISQRSFKRKGSSYRAATYFYNRKSLVIYRGETDLDKAHLLRFARGCASCDL